MIIEQNVPVVAVVEIISVVLIVFSLRHLAIAKHFESEADKKIMIWFMLGLILAGIGSIANVIGVFGLHSYLVNGISFQVFWALAPMAFLIGVIKLRKS